MRNLLFTIFIILHRLIKGAANRLLDKDKIRPRNFSNRMLKKYAPYVLGSVINVSGWKDEDGQNGHYKDYFINASNYTVSNVGGQGKGFGSASAAGYMEIELNLLDEMPESLKGTFDAVFNHTTLEHIYDFHKAFNTLCSLSNDLVIVVVPVMQQIHHTADFGDYWRPTTMTLAKMFIDNGLTPLVLKCNEQPFAPIYCFAMASRKPENYRSKFEENIDFQMGAHNYGSSLNVEALKTLLSK